MVTMESVGRRGEAFFRAKLTGKDLKDARDGEPLSLREGEELGKKHNDSDDGENTGKHRGGLHCLEVVYRGSQREEHN